MKTALLTSLPLLLALVAPNLSAARGVGGESAGSSADYEEAIRNIEIQSGAFEGELVEPLDSLGDLLTESGQHEQALALYIRALHINRINSGFYDQSHIKLVDKIIANNAALQRWDDLDNNHDYLYWLSQRAFPHDADKREAGLARVFNWKLAFFALQTQPDRSRILLELEDIADERIELLSETEGDSHLSLATALYDRALIHYLYAVALDENDRTGRRLLEREHPQLQNARGLTLFDSGILLSNEQIRPAILRQMQRGRRLLEQILEKAAAEGESPEARQSQAMAELYLGDWDLLMGRQGPAFEAYRNAYARLLEAGLPGQELDAHFARPVVLPRDSFMNRLPEARGDPDEKQLADYVAWTRVLPGLGFPGRARADYLDLEQEFVELGFDLDLDGKTFKTRDPHASALKATGEGNTDGAEIISDSAVGAESRRKALQELQLLTFRPRLVGGEAVATRDLRMKYFFAKES